MSVVWERAFLELYDTECEFISILEAFVQDFVLPITSGEVEVAVEEEVKELLSVYPDLLALHSSLKSKFNENEATPGLAFKELLPQFSAYDGYDFTLRQKKIKSNPLLAPFIQQFEENHPFSVSHAINLPAARLGKIRLILVELKEESTQESSVFLTEAEQSLQSLFSSILLTQQKHSRSSGNGRE